MSTETVTISAAGGGAGSVTGGTGGGAGSVTGGTGGYVYASKPIGYAVVLADQLDKTRTLSFQLNFAQGSTEAEMNAELDKLVAVFDRQRAKAAIYEVEQFVKAQKNILKGIEEDLERGQQKLVLLQKPDTTRRNVPNEVQQLTANVEQQKIMLSNVRDKIAAAEEELDLLRKKAA